ncbi:MAG: fructosamine kinase family protein [Robiginitalea sp.]|nr:fructosamine kinase family protein [Robiginitalea sp.]
MAGSNLIQALEGAFGLEIRKLHPVRGGDIAASYLLETPEGSVFAKMLEGPKGLEMLEAEKDGLTALSQAGTLGVPGVLGCTRTPAGSCLLLEYIPAGPGSRASSRALGRGLAGLHQVSAPSFGWARPNFIGTLPQENKEASKWPVFYVQSRLAPQYELARSRQLLTVGEVPAIDRMEARVADLVPEVSPSLLHGDLWSGNYLISAEGRPYLIDPAVYYGHAEVDLAMSLLFGGFSEEFYNAYFEINPKQPGFDLRVKLYQLYYLLVHLNLFGRSYHASVRAITSDLFE